MPTVPFAPEPNGPEIQAVERAADKGSIEDTPSDARRNMGKPLGFDATVVLEKSKAVVPEAPKGAAPPARTSRVNLFQHPDTHPFVLDVALFRKYGLDWFDWEMSTLEARIQRDFNTQTVSELTFDKLRAIKTLHRHSTFWTSVLVFPPLALALSGVHADFRVLQALTVPQMMIAVDIAAKLRSDVPYGQEVRTYMSVAHVHDGMLVPIEPLTDLVEIDTSSYDVDVDKIRDQWDKVRIENKAPTTITPENIQLQRMLEAHQYLEESRRQLREQLPLVYHD